VKTGVCGDGIVDPGEECDDGDRFNPDDCCDANCKIVPGTLQPCTLSDGYAFDACEVRQPTGICRSGVCRGKPKLDQTPCRDPGTLGLCDAGATCDGLSRSCPASVPRRATEHCVDPLSLKSCDVDVMCDGVGLDCPSNGQDAGCTATVNDEDVGSIAITCEAQAETVSGGTSTCTAQGEVPASTSGALGTGSIVAPPGTVITKHLKVKQTTLKTQGNERRRVLRLQLNKLGTKLLKQRLDGRLPVLLKIRIVHGTSDVPIERIVTVLRKGKH